MEECWRLPIFPGRRQPSIFGTSELNFCVRNGNRWTLTVINTNYSIDHRKEDGDPWGNRTPVSGVRGLRLNRLTNGPFLHGPIAAPWKPNRGRKRGKGRLRLPALSRLSPRVISTSQLNVLPHVHLWPIYDVVYIDPYSFRMGELISGGVSRLDAFSVYLFHT